MRIGTRPARHSVCSQRDGNVDVSAKHHGVGNGQEMRSVLVQVAVVQSFVTLTSVDTITLIVDIQIMKGA